MKGAVRTSQAIFDIFRVEPDGSELQVGEAASYSIALMDVEMLASKIPAKYVVCDRETGQRWLMNLGRLDSSSYRLPGS